MMDDRDELESYIFFRCGWDGGRDGLFGEALGCGYGLGWRGTGWVGLGFFYIADTKSGILGCNSHRKVLRNPGGTECY